ncbi:MAG: HAD family hydrolase [Lachnospiraceae bacterium]|nr:HAD family hydrolase [Lachnospiraceae bacterium]
MMKAIVFDIGQTLVEYNKPLNWSELYRPAFESIADKCGYTFSDSHYQHAVRVLTQYNTRVNPRDYEVTSDQIFSEIISGMDIPMKDIEKVKRHFYSYFRQDTSLFPEVEETLKRLSDIGILLGTLSDVAYAMDNVYALEDIRTVIKYIDYPLTSNDVGYRKPRAEGLKLLAEKMKVDMKEMTFVGDEEKDIMCAANAGAYSVLINRSDTIKNYGQDKEIKSLGELLTMVE